MLRDLRGLSAAITGAGDGIGRAAALRLADLGMNLAILDIREEAALLTAEDCSRRGVRAVGLSCDVSIPEATQVAADAANDLLGPIALVWANAGVLAHGGLTTLPCEMLRWMFSANVDGVINTVRAFAPQLRQQTGWRKIAITASTAGLVHAPSVRSSAYCATKHAVVGIGEALRTELMEEGIGVTLFCPGIANTRIWDGAKARPERFGGKEHKPEEAGDLWRRIGMDVQQLAVTAVEGVRNDEFLVIVPGGACVGRIETRAETVQRGIRTTSKVTAGG